MIRAGDLDRRITLRHRAQTTLEPYGEVVDSFQDFATISAAVRQISGREFLSAGAVVAERRAVFTIRYRADVLVTDRVVFAGAPFDIREIREIGRREGLEIHAEAVG
jgi:SPP1 family predicted phage head-tail adaptor